MQLYARNLYRGKETLFGNGYSFIIPKASSLKACIYLTMCFKSSIGKICILQRDLYMAIAWCQATGIYGKMWQDVIYKTKSQIMMPDTLSSKIRAVEPLSLEHLIPPFIMTAMGLALSAITFCAEKYHQRRTLREKWGFFQRKQVNKKMVAKPPRTKTVLYPPSSTLMSSFI